MRSWFKKNIPAEFHKPLSELYWWNHRRGRHPMANFVNPRRHAGRYVSDATSGGK